MITALELENFKGIGPIQRIEFAPLTLLFGANSAGKSTVLQALIYLHELIGRGGADVNRTELGGTTLDLGGFHTLVHRHEVNRPIVLRAEFTTPRSLERFGRLDDELAFEDLDDATESAWLELTVRQRMVVGALRPIVDRVVIGLGKEREPLVILETANSVREGDWLNVRVNMGHPALGDQGFEVRDRWQAIAIPDYLAYRSDEEQSEDEDDHRLRDGANLGDPQRLLDFAVHRSRLSALPPAAEPIRVIPHDDEDIDGFESGQCSVEVRMFLEMVVLGTTAQLSEALQDALYIGPIRAVPPRGSLYERTGKSSSWADGLAAWDLLLSDRMDLVEHTNVWLDKLGAGCKISVQQLYDQSASAEAITQGHVDQTVRRLLLDAGLGLLVLPSQVGAGISQMVPFIVGALEPSGALLLVEQPEIHVHPALQVGLGDLCIEATTRARGQRAMIVETHSEHLILRLLRRVRQTTEGDLDEGAPSFAAEQLSVLYVERLPDGVRIRRLRVDERGEFVDRWPNGFFGERAEELF